MSGSSGDNQNVLDFLLNAVEASINIGGGFGLGIFVLFR